MKKVLYSMLMLFPVLSFAQSTFTLTGRIGTLNKPAKVYLQYKYNDQAIRDSSDIQNGYFKFTGKLDYPVPASVTVNHTGKPLRGVQPDQNSFYLEPGKLQFRAGDSIKNAYIQNSVLNNDYQTLKNSLKPIDDEYMQLYRALVKMTPEEQKEGKLRAEIFQKMDANKEKRNDTERAFLKSHPNSLASLLAIQEVAGPIPDVKKTMVLYNSLSADVRNSKPGKLYNDYLQNLSNVAVGQQAPDFIQPDTAGKNVSLASFRGKYVLIDFWASWCGPCRAENPNVVKNYDIYHVKGLEILGVSLDRTEDRSRWLQAIHDDHLNWTQVSDLKFWKNDVAKLYGVRAIPQNFLIDPNGRIIAKNIRGEALSKKLSELFD